MSRRTTVDTAALDALIEKAREYADECDFQFTTGGTWAQDVEDIVDALKRREMRA